MNNFTEEKEQVEIKKETGFQDPELRKRAMSSLCINRRRTHGFCEKCGADTSDHQYGVECIENYSNYDRRSKELRKLMKQSIPIKEKVTVSDKVNVAVAEVVNPKKIEKEIKTETNIPNMIPDADPILQRKYIMVDITKPEDGSMFDADFINFYAKQYPDHVVVLCGSPKGYPPFFTFVETKKQKNVSDILINTDKQTMVNYLAKCDFFITFYSEYVLYCRKNEVKCICFMVDGKEELENEYVSVMDMTNPMLVTTKIFSQITTDSFLPI